MAFRLRGLDRVAVSFFGDGASNIGAFHEGLNLAAVQARPVVFVCENNLYAASTHISLTMQHHRHRRPGRRLWHAGRRRRRHGCRRRLRAPPRKPSARARHGDGPTLLECKTYRYRGHSRGDPGGYRDAEEHDEWVARDPIERTKRQAGRSDFAMPPERLAEIDRQAQVKVEAAVPSPSPAPSRSRPTSRVTYSQTESRP